MRLLLPPGVVAKLLAPSPAGAAMPFDPDDNTFLLAGPVKMHSRVRAAMARPAVAHRDPGFMDVNKRMQERLREVFQTSAPIVTLAGSGTAGMDAAAQTLL